ncbi:MAG: NAD+ synthase [Candidatus Omnitrophota bacterium]
MLRLSIAQINPIVGDLNGNKRKILDFINKAKNLQADLVVFPELAVCGYPPEDLLHKEHFVSDNLRTLKNLAKEVSGITVVVGFVDIGNKKEIYNAAGILAQGEIKGIYHKEELPNYGVFDEKRYFTPGNNNNIYTLGYDYFAVNICEDLWIENGIYQKQALQGASLIINISSSPYDIQKHRSREKLVKKRAQETNSFFCYANLVGGQDELVFDGGSFIVNPKGKIMAEAHRFEEDLIAVDISLSESRERKYKPFDIVEIMQPIHKNKTRTISKYLNKDLKPIEGVFKALVLGTRDYVFKNGFQKVLLGLSGGIDSALVAALAVEAVGAENVVGVTMPSRYTSKETKSDAKTLAKNLGIEYLEISIEGIFKSYLDTLSGPFKGIKADTTEENVQARIRGNILMALSNKFGWLVLTTGNKSEVAVGYCTLYGDMSGGFAVIKDISKTQVYKLVELFNLRHNPGIPESIIKRAPSAELRLNQKDQDSLPPYDMLDEILKGYVEQHKSPSVLSRKFDNKIVSEIVRKVDISEYKRRQAPPGIKITQRAFGKDWRLPITNKYQES